MISEYWHLIVFSIVIGVFLAIALDLLSGYIVRVEGRVLSKQYKRYNSDDPEEELEVFTLLIESGGKTYEAQTSGIRYQNVEEGDIVCFDYCKGGLLGIYWGSKY